MTRWKIKFHGPVSAPLVGWIKELIPLLRSAPAGTIVTVELVADEEPGGQG